MSADMGMWNLKFDQNIVLPQRKQKEGKNEPFYSIDNSGTEQTWIWKQFGNDSLQIEKTLRVIQIIRHTLKGGGANVPKCGRGYESNQKCVTFY